MEEEIETKPEEIVEEQPKVSFLEKLKIHKWKILGGVLGLLVLAGAVFSAYKLGQRQVSPELVEGPTPTPEVVATPTPDPTANWKTYTNTKYGYSVKLPPNWGSWNPHTGEFSPEIDQTSSMVLLGEKKAMVTPGFPPQDVEMEVHMKENWIGFKEEVEQHDPGMKCREEKVKIGKNNILAKKISCPITTRGPSYEIEKNSYIYVIDNVMEDSSGWSTFNLMLSTFRFLEEGKKD